MYSREELYWLPITLLIMVGIGIGLYFLLRNKSAKIKLIPFMVIAVAIAGLEVAKQICALNGVGGFGFNSKGTYGLFSIPLHFCSIAIFAYPFAVFLKQGTRAANIAWALSLTATVISTIALYVAPQLIISDAPAKIEAGIAKFDLYHTYLVHNLTVLFLICAIAFKPYKPRFSDLAFGVAIYGGFMAFSAIMAAILKTDFARFRNFPLGPFNAIRDSAGMFWSMLTIWFTYMIVAAISAALVLYVPRLYKHIQSKLKKQDTNKNEI